MKWHATNYYDELVSVVDEDGFEVVDVDHMPILFRYEEKLNIDHWAHAPGVAYLELSLEEQAKRAYLVAAAPELLEALENARLLISTLTDPDAKVPHRTIVAQSVLPALDSAIAKAKGE